DGHVTGVQTCALPIWVGLEGNFRAALVGRADLLQHALRLARFKLLLIHRAAAADLGLAPDGEKINRLQADAVQAARRFIGPLVRSEERRVGKECSTPW